MLQQKVLKVSLSQFYVSRPRRNKDFHWHDNNAAEYQQDKPKKITYTTSSNLKSSADAFWCILSMIQKIRLLFQAVHHIEDKLIELKNASVVLKYLSML